MWTAVIAASLLLSGALAAAPESSQSLPCGAGIGDLRGSAASEAACEACGGTLYYDASAADGLGYTGCRDVWNSAPAPAPVPAPSEPACGAGVGDLRGSAESQAACEACGGTLDYDASAADGLGYTGCLAYR